jgi:serine phosphatase RsbU (regulator of sigma subunit)
MGKTIREFATEFSTDIKQVQNKVAYIRRKNKQFGKLNKSGVREFSTAEIKYLKEVLNLTEKPTELSTELSSEQNRYLEQIDEYKEQIKTLNRLLENQQILTKQAQDQNQNLLLENVEIKKELSEEKNKGFWQKIFRK